MLMPSQNGTAQCESLKVKEDSGDKCFTGEKLPYTFISHYIAIWNYKQRKITALKRNWPKPFVDI